MAYFFDRFGVLPPPCKIPGSVPAQAAAYTGDRPISLDNFFSLEITGPLLENHLKLLKLLFLIIFIIFLIVYLPLQPIQINMAVLLWYLVKSDASVNATVAQPGQVTFTR